MMLIYDKVSYMAPYRKPWQSLKRWCESYLNNSVNVPRSNRPLASSRFPTAVQLPPSADGGVFGKVCRAPLFLL